MPLDKNHLQVRSMDILPCHQKSSKASSDSIFCAGRSFKGQIADLFLNFFESIGHCVYDHAWSFILVPTILCAICSFGFYKRQAVYDMDKLYSLPISTTKLAEIEMLRFFPIQRTTFIFLISKSGEGLLTKQAFEELDQMWDKLITLEIPLSVTEDASNPQDTAVRSYLLKGPQKNKLQYEPHYVVKRLDTKAQYPRGNETFLKFGDVCERTPYDICNVINPLDLYLFPSQRATPIVSNDYPNFINIRTRMLYRLDSFMSGLDISFDEKRLVTLVHNATGMAFRLNLLGGELSANKAAAWEEGAITFLQQFRPPSMDIYVRSDRSVNDELARSSTLTGNDLAMLLVASCAVSLFTVFMHSSWDWYRTKTIPTFVGVATTILAYGGAIGLLYWLGVKHVPPAEATPFMMLGICVDDVFVITNSYTLTHLYIDQPRRRVGLSIRDSGVSITITTLTNVIAFVAGALSPYYSIRIFCILTAFGLFVSYVLCLTIFLGTLSLAARHEQRRRDSQNALRFYEQPPRKQDERDLARSRSFAPERLEEAPANFPENMPLQESPLSLPSMEPLGEERSAQPSSEEEWPEREAVSLFRELAKERRANPACQAVQSMHARCPLALASPAHALVAHSLESNWVGHTSAPDMSTLKTVATEASATSEDLKNGLYQLIYLNNYAMITYLCARQKRASCCAARWRGARRSRVERSDPWASLEEAIKSYRCHDLPAIYSLHTSDTLRRRRAPQKDGSSAAARDVRFVHFADGLPPEPRGNVGRLPRRLFMHYGPCLLFPLTKAIVFLFFFLLTAGSIFMVFRLEAGLSLLDITPDQSYLRDFLMTRSQHFTAYGDECILFFTQAYQSPQKSRWHSNFLHRSNHFDAGGGASEGHHAWWLPENQKSVMELNGYLSRSSHVVYVLNGMVYFFEWASRNRRLLDSEEAFMDALQSWTETIEGNILSSDFIIENNTLKAWRIHYWMSYVDNTRTAIGWIEEDRAFLKNLTELEAFPHGYIYSPLAVHWESDLTVFQMTLTTMMAALLAMSVIAFFMLESWIAGFVVLLDIVLIDLTVMGTMPLIGLKLNMLTMVNLVLSIGFAVDYTTHITHCFTHCQGTSKNQRALESLYSIGFPITEGMITTYLAVGVLAASRKYIMIVVFRMMTCVLLYASLHGIVFIPVLLSVIGPFYVDTLRILEIESGRLRNLWFFDPRSAKVIADPAHRSRRAPLPDKDTTFYVAKLERH